MGKTRAPLSDSFTERGSVTAEFVVLLPAVCLVLALSLCGLQLGTLHMRLHDAAALAARSEARGGDGESLVSSLVSEARMRSEHRGNLVCVRVESPGPPFAALLGLAAIAATGCALADGK